MKTVCENEGIKVQSGRTCYLCGAEGRILYGGLRDRLFSAPGEWNLKKCPNPECDLIWLDPIPTQADIHKVYTIYYTHQVRAGEMANVGLWSILQRKFRVAFDLAYGCLLYPIGLSQERFNVATMYLANYKLGRLLEIGCGNGAFLDRMRSRGWIVQGVEVDPKASKIAEEMFAVPVFVGTLENANYVDDYFDAITMNHIIEHVHNPITLLRECYRILKPGGYLVMVTPNVRSLGHARFGRHWRGLEPPRHLHLFSESTLETIASKAGFQNIEVWTTPANAEVIALGSIDIQSGGNPGMGGVPSLSRSLMSKWFQLRALTFYWKHPGSGEEAVLRASK
jgi:2-polyprenyl-3-methyl-5-hydroxy-6-metoxy-1,4-benzoquinol methylase